MPKALNHSKCRALLCLICVEKKKCVRPISEGVKVLIETHYQAGLDYVKDDRLPTKICEQCRQHLRDMSNGKRMDRPKVFNYKLLDFPPERRNGMYM